MKYNIPNSLQDAKHRRSDSLRDGGYQGEHRDFPPDCKRGVTPRAAYKQDIPLAQFLYNRFCNGKRYIRSVCIFIAISFSGIMWGHQPKDFDQAKKMARVIWNEHRETFYCGCAYDRYGVINFGSCSYTPKNKRKDKMIGWEHVVPVSWYGKKLGCWKEDICVNKKGKSYHGRNCCRKTDSRFRKMEADLHNLVPIIRDVNFARGNYHFAEFHLEEKRDKFYFNQCNVIIDERYRLIEPRDEVKGMVARINLYMADKYGIDLGKKQRKLFTDWNSRYAPTKWEKRWNQKVALITGELNPYIQSEGSAE